MHVQGLIILIARIAANPEKYPRNDCIMVAYFHRPNKRFYYVLVALLWEVVENTVHPYSFYVFRDTTFLPLIVIMYVCVCVCVHECNDRNFNENKMQISRIFILHMSSRAGSRGVQGVS
jgi:hypothetical protein